MYKPKKKYIFIYKIIYIYPLYSFKRFFRAFLLASFHRETLRRRDEENVQLQKQLASANLEISDIKQQPKKIYLDDGHNLNVENKVLKKQIKSINEKVESLVKQLDKEKKKKLKVTAQRASLNIAKDQAIKQLNADKSEKTQLEKPKALLEKMLTDERDKNEKITKEDKQLKQKLANEMHDNERLKKHVLEIEEKKRLRRNELDLVEQKLLADKDEQINNKIMKLEKENEQYVNMLKDSNERNYQHIEEKNRLEMELNRNMKRNTKTEQKKILKAKTKLDKEIVNRVEEKRQLDYELG